MFLEILRTQSFRNNTIIYHVQSLSLRERKTRYRCYKCENTAKSYLHGACRVDKQRIRLYHVNASEYSWFRVAQRQAVRLMSTSCLPVKSIIPTGSKPHSTSTTIPNAALDRLCLFCPAQVLIPTIRRIWAFGRESEGLLSNQNLIAISLLKSYPQVQVVLETISPHLSAAKVILMSVIWALNPRREYKDITLAITKRAVKVVTTISTLIETTSETPQLVKNIVQLEE